MSNWNELANLVNVSCQQALGTPVSYQPTASEAFTVVGVLDRTSDEQRQSDGVYLRCFVHLADFAVTPDRGDEVTIGEIVYTVFEVLVDAGGGAWLSLRAVV